jgi:hypothetical protein
MLKNAGYMPVTVIFAGFSAFARCQDGVILEKRWLHAL